MAEVESTLKNGAPVPDQPTMQTAVPVPGEGGRKVGFPWHIVAPAALFVLVILAFLPALMADFVDWDDDDLLFATTAYRLLDADSLHWMFTTSYAGHFQPLTWLTYSFDWAIWGRNAFGYHLTNVLLHALTALAVCFLARRLMTCACQNGRWSDFLAPVQSCDRSLVLCSTLAAALFAIHPLRAESVAWLSERRDVLSGFFLVTAVVAYLRFAASSEKPRLWYGVALALQFLSLLAKATAATLPLVLLVLDFYPLRRLRHRGSRFGKRLPTLLLEKTPFFALAILGGGRAWLAQSDAGAMYPLSEYDLSSRFAQACYGFVFYLGKTIWPANLGPLYPLPPREILFGPMLYASAAAVTLIVILAFVLRRRMPAVAASVMAYAVIVAPVLGFFQSGPQLVADRYSYLSCIGFAMLPPAALHAWLRRSDALVRTRALGIVVVTASVLTGLFHATAAQANIWSSSLHLWARGVEVSPESSIANANYADGLAAIGNLSAAEYYYRRSLKLAPQDPVTANHYADLLVRMGDRNQAEGMYRWTLRLDPHRAQAVVRLARLMVLGGRPCDAVDLLRARVDADPTDLSAAGALSDLLSTHPDGAIRDGEEAAVLAAEVSSARGGNDAPSLLLWATALAEAGRYDEGIATARRALRIAEHDQNDRLATELRKRLDYFEQYKPFHVGD